MQGAGGGEAGGFKEVCEHSGLKARGDRRGSTHFCG